jgi:flagellar hook-associated protein 3 FlgL
MTRVANYAQHERNLSYILDAQRRLTMGQLQISSGKKAENFSGVASDARRLVNVESNHIRTTQYMANNNLIEQRLQSMETSVSQAFEVITEYKTLLINALNSDNVADLAMPIQAQSNLEDDGRFLFAGNYTNTPPVDQTALPGSYTLPTSDGDSSGYYQGDSTVLSVQADDNFTVGYGVTANEIGFERAIRAMHMVVIGPPNDRAMLEDALGVIDQAIKNVADIRTRIGASRAAIENVNTRLTEFQLFSEKTIGDIENTDITEVITQMNVDQVAVEASFSIISRLSDLNLMRFLR